MAKNLKLAGLDENSQESVEWKAEGEDEDEDFNWVIGQEWDPNGSGIVLSDFFHGAISDVRIYERALSKVEVEKDMYLPPLLYSPDDSKSKRPDLIGWWPLAQTAQAAGQLGDCVLPKTGKLSTETPTPEGGALKAETTIDKSCKLVDLGPNHLAGARSGGSWENKNASFGDALAFNGSNVLYLNRVALSNFTENPTEAATDQPDISPPPPAKTPAPFNTPTFTPTSSNMPPSTATSVPQGTGLKGDYYLGKNFETFVTDQTDPDVDFPDGPSAERYW